MSFAKVFAQQSRTWILAEMAICAGIIAVLDLISGTEIRLLPFYAGPIFVAGWFCGRRAALLMAAFCGAIWWSANWFTGDPELHSWIWEWETFRHLGFFLVVAWAAAALRAKSDIAAARIALLEHSQRLEHEIVTISDAEQRRIGQDLHDGLCQDLAALSCAATSLRDDLQKLHLTAESKMAAELAHRLREAVVQTRDLARGLVPAHVGQVGLVLALESLAQSVTRLHGVSCTFGVQGRAVRCDENTAMDLYRIAQEAINNATRHGKATKIDLTLASAGDMVALRIVDNGVGFSSTKSDGLGLNIMRYRARLLGGEVKVEEPASGGITITCTARTKPQKDEIAVA